MVDSAVDEMDNSVRALHDAGVVGREEEGHPVLPVEGGHDVEQLLRRSSQVRDRLGADGERPLHGGGESREREGRGAFLSLAREQLLDDERPGVGVGRLLDQELQLPVELRLVGRARVPARRGGRGGRRSDSDAGDALAERFIGSRSSNK